MLLSSSRRCSTGIRTVDCAAHLSEKALLATLSTRWDWYLTTNQPAGSSVAR